MIYTIFQYSKKYSKKYPNGIEYTTTRSMTDPDFQNINFVHYLADKWNQEDFLKHLSYCVKEKEIVFEFQNKKILTYHIIGNKWEAIEL